MPNRAAKDLGLTIDLDISIVAYDGIPEGAYTNAVIATFAVDNRQAGGRLATMLLDRIQGRAPEELRELAPARFVERGSDRPLTRSSVRPGAPPTKPIS